MQENLEWSFSSVAVGIAVAVFAALGGILAQKFGFTIVFFLGGILTSTSLLYQIKIFKDLKEKVPRGTVRPVVK